MASMITPTQWVTWTFIVLLYCLQVCVKGYRPRLHVHVLGEWFCVYSRECTRIIVNLVTWINYPLTVNANLLPAHI